MCVLNAEYEGYGKEFITSILCGTKDNKMNAQFTERNMSVMAF